jgi:hypothetical protein
LPLPTQAPTNAPFVASDGGGEPRSAGHWLLWNSCAPGNRAATAAANGGRAAGWIILDDLLVDPGVLVGGYAVETCEQGDGFQPHRPHRFTLISLRYRYSDHGSRQIRSCPPGRLRRRASPVMTTPRQHLHPRPINSTAAGSTPQRRAFCLGAVHRQRARAGPGQIGTQIPGLNMVRNIHRL